MMIDGIPAPGPYLFLPKGHDWGRRLRQVLRQVPYQLASSAGSWEIHRGNWELFGGQVPRTMKS
jgi:hypothetical protein